MPVVPSCLLEPAWAGFCALLDERRGGELPQFQPGHPLGCHPRRVPGRVVFEHVVAALVHGSGYVGSPARGARTAPSVGGWPNGGAGPGQGALRR